MAAKKSDPRGPVVVVTQEAAIEGPEVWFPYCFGTPERRLSMALRTALKIELKFRAHRPDDVLFACVQERGEWVPA